ncbi:2-dehydropantoate 2-reductase [Undibacterium terreum]|uniref:2-dehydropantoate 2-reductase n=1 Tax=Undibacterium terreum TaxID=1224302 RepID=A0A916UHP5_9BURK|nr:2-dehydropantoate 2-reductase [Undibacterium terreum]GGC72312.1 2-dehydropantoate 2-reductase [Undibacterium terreum]
MTDNTSAGTKMKDLKITIVGAGAVGGLIAARLEHAGIRTSVLARGAHLAAIQSNGLKLLEQEQELTSHPRAAASADELGAQDIVFLCLKAPALFESVQSLQGLISADTVIVPAMNGVPWWFMAGIQGPYADTWLKTTDPQHNLSDYLPPAQVLGCVVHLGSTIQGPGVIRRGMGNQLIIGEPDGSRSSRLELVAGLLAQAGFEVKASENIRQDIWTKLWGNMNMNPISALTSSTLDAILDDPLTHQLVLDMMEEAKRIGEKIGIQLPMDARERTVITRKLGAFKTSMLQDLEAGRQMEIDPILAVAHELAQVVGVDTPFINAVLGLVRQRARNAGLYTY